MRQCKQVRVSAVAVTLLLAGTLCCAQSVNELRAKARNLFGVIAPPTPSEIEAPTVHLGQALFWDTRLSANGEIACASCHLADAWGADRRQFSINARGAPTGRHAQTVFNTQTARAGLRWVGDRSSGAEQAIGSITGSMGFSSRDDIIAVLLEHGYGDLFARAFPGSAEPVSAAHYGEALEAYQRTLRTPASFDRWLEGDDTAMSDVQVRGLSLFISIGCSSCHSGPLLGGDSLQRFGVTEDYWAYTGSKEIDAGLGGATGEDSDRYMFRVQPLRNVARTAPYFHDGSVFDLTRATEIMARVQLGLVLDETDLAELIAFQQALSGSVPKNYAPPDSHDD